MEQNLLPHSPACMMKLLTGMIFYLEIVVNDPGLTFPSLSLYGKQSHKQINHVTKILGSLPS